MTSVTLCQICIMLTHTLSSLVCFELCRTIILSFSNSFTCTYSTRNCYSPDKSEPHTVSVSRGTQTNTHGGGRVESSEGWLPRGGGIWAEIRMRKSWGWEGKMDTFQRKETYAKHPEVRGNRRQAGHLGDCK